MECESASLRMSFRSVEAVASFRQRVVVSGRRKNPKQALILGNAAKPRQVERLER